LMGVESQRQEATLQLGNAPTGRAIGRKERGKNDD
jgi:hypothetical protein